MSKPGVFVTGPATAGIGMALVAKLDRLGWRVVPEYNTTAHAELLARVSTPMTEFPEEEETRCREAIPPTFYQYRRHPSFPVSSLNESFSTRRTGKSASDPELFATHWAPRNLLAIFQGLDLLLHRNERQRQMTV